MSETASGGDLSSAYSALFAAMQANGEMNDQAASQLKSAFNQLETKSQGGAQDASVSGGGCWCGQAGRSLSQAFRPPRTLWSIPSSTNCPGSSIRTVRTHLPLSSLGSVKQRPIAKYSHFASERAGSEPGYLAHVVMLHGGAVSCCAGESGTPAKCRRLRRCNRGLVSRS